MLDPLKILAACPPSLPRYTSYPTAPQFMPNGVTQLSSRLLSEAAASDAISVYLHIPFCDRLCWFCGCHTKQTLKYEPVRAYAGYLEQEIRLTAQRMQGKPLLKHIHLGGGSPSMLKAEDFARLRGALEQLGRIDASSEISVEVDPSDDHAELLQGLARLGVTRCSIGVQDFAPEVQAAINRLQSVETTRRTIEDLRSLGINSLNIDILYGLPLQTLERLLATVDAVISLQPDRIALFGYAHVPWMKKHQTMIDEAALPGDIERYQHAAAAAERLILAGYERIGLDHFAKPGDSMAQAAASGQLHRNFQGYTTDDCPVLMGFGASAISRCSSGLLQTIVPTAQYEQSIMKGDLPHARGIAFSPDDRLRGWLIERLMCDLKLSKDLLAGAFPENATTGWRLVEEAHASLEPGLSELSDGVFRVPEVARNFVRLAAAKFDAYLSSSPARYSKAV